MNERVQAQHTRTAKTAEWRPHVQRLFRRPQREWPLPLLLLALLAACLLTTLLLSAHAQCSTSVSGGSGGSCSGSLRVGASCSYACPLGAAIAPLQLHCEEDGTMLHQTCAECGVGYSLDWTLSSLKAVGDYSAAAASSQMGSSVSTE
jgi:hypothetical protein